MAKFEDDGMAELMDILGMDEASDLAVAQVKEEDEDSNAGDAVTGATEKPKKVTPASTAASVGGAEAAMSDEPVEQKCTTAGGPSGPPPKPASLEGVVPYPYKEWLRDQTAYGECSA